MKESSWYNLEVSPQVKEVLGRFGESPVNRVNLKKVSEKHHVPLDFLVQIILAFADTRQVNAKQFEDYSIDVLIDYLIRSHNYYRNHYIPELYHTIECLAIDSANGVKLKKLLNDFVFFYEQDLEAHFEDEEKGLFPYALKLAQMEYSKEFELDKDIGSYSLSLFEMNHDHGDKELKEVRDAFINYLPNSNTDILCRVFKIFKDFEIDMEVHGFIEDSVLMPKLYQIENRFKSLK